MDILFKYNPNFVLEKFYPYSKPDNKILVSVGMSSYSYIMLQVRYHSYYMSPRRSRGRVLTMISHESA